VAAIRERHPEAHITYVVEPAAAPIVATNPHISELIVAPHRRGLRRIADDLSLARRLRRARFDVAIDLHGGPRSAWLTWLSRAPVRVGYDIPGRSWMYTHVAHRPRELRPRHSVANQWDLLPTWDPAFGDADARRHRVEIPVAADAAAAIDQRLRDWRVDPGDQLIVLHVSAGNPFRRWPEASFAELAAALVSTGRRRRLVATGGPSDRAATERVLAAARGAAGADAGARLIDGETLSLAELRALCDRAALYIGGDSGPLHLASASDVPIVGLFGPTLAVRSLPWRPPEVPSVSVDAGPLECRPCDQRECAPGDFRCLTRLSADDVRAAAERLLAVAAVGETKR
jgi:ADP-heptose:LPS heptosyltransferase